MRNGLFIASPGVDTLLCLEIVNRFYKIIFEAVYFSPLGIIWPVHFDCYLVKPNYLALAFAAKLSIGHFPQIVICIKEKTEKFVYVSRIQVFQTGSCSTIQITSRSHPSIQTCGNIQRMLLSLNGPH